MSHDIIDTGTSTIDAEHRVQLGLIQALCEAVESGNDTTLAGTVLEQLIQYSDVHFMSEELLMRLASYEEYEEHIDDHGQMIEVLKLMRENLRAGKSELVVGGAQTALAFLLRHIETRDARFAASLNR